jgi:hypothetical protein
VASEAVAVLAVAVDLEEALEAAAVSAAALVEEVSAVAAPAADGN